MNEWMREKVYPVFMLNVAAEEKKFKHGMGREEKSFSDYFKIIQRVCLKNI